MAASDRQLGRVQVKILRWLLAEEVRLVLLGDERQRRAVSRRGVPCVKVHMAVDEQPSSVSDALRGRGRRLLVERGLVVLAAAGDTVPHEQNGEHVWDAIQEQDVVARQPAGTVGSVASRGERHTSGHATDDGFGRVVGARGPRYLGRFQRELLMHLAAREARVVNHGSPADRRRLKGRGLEWRPAAALHQHIDYTQSLADRVSKALKALEEIGYVRTTGHPDGRRRTTHVKLTTAGVREAVDIAGRWGHSRRSWRTQPDVHHEVEALKRELLESSTEQEHAAIMRQLRRARRVAMSEMELRDDLDRNVRDLMKQLQRSLDEADVAAALQWEREYDRLFGASSVWEKLEHYADMATRLREDVATSSSELLRGWADYAEAMLFRFFRE